MTSYLELYRMTTAGTAVPVAPDVNIPFISELSGARTLAGIPARRKTGESETDAAYRISRNRLMRYEVMMSRTPTENPAPYAEEVRKPDTGFQGTRYVFNALFMPGSDAVATLVKWYRESSDVPGVFTDGRFGFKLTGHGTEFNIHPERYRGLKLASVHFIHQIEFGKQHATIILEQSGDAAVTA